MIDLKKQDVEVFWRDKLENLSGLALTGVKDELSLWVLTYFYLFFLISCSSKRIWRHLLALETSPTKCTGSLWSGGLSSPSWLLVRAQISVFALVLQESLHWLLLRSTSDAFPVFLFVYVCESECVCEWSRGCAEGTLFYYFWRGEHDCPVIWINLETFGPDFLAAAAS